MTKPALRYLLLFAVAWTMLTAILVALLAFANLVGRHYGILWQYGALVLVVGLYSAFMVRGFLKDVGPVASIPRPYKRPETPPAKPPEKPATRIRIAP